MCSRRIPEPFVARPLRCSCRTRSAGALQGQDAAEDGGAKYLPRRWTLCTRPALGSQRVPGSLHTAPAGPCPARLAGLVRALPQAHHGTVRSLTAWRLCGAGRGAPAHGHGHATSRMVTRCAGGVREEGKGGAVVTTPGWQSAQEARAARCLSLLQVGTFLAVAEEGRRLAATRGPPSWHASSVLPSHARRGFRGLLLQQRPRSAAHFEDH